MANQKVIALFGASGSTGKEVLKLALDQNYLVNALVRSPEKFGFSNHKLNIVAGDLLDKEAISKVVSNADYIICVAGYSKPSHKNLMFNFIQTLHPIMVQERVNNLIYQANALCYLPKKEKPFLVKLTRNFIGRLTGLEKSLADHDKVIDYIKNKMPAKKFNVIVTLPGAGGLNLGASEKDLTVQDKVVFQPSKFIDVAKFTINNMGNKKYAGKLLYIA